MQSSGSTPRSSLVVGVIALVVLLVIGTVGYMVIEGWSFLEAVYMTVITLSTVGYKEVRPLSTPGLVFTIGIIVVGVAVALYIFPTVIGYVVGAEFPDVMRRRRVLDRISGLRDHHIVCGFGRVGEHAAKTLARANVPFVVIDQQGAGLSRCEAAGYLCMEGDATKDSTLKEAGVERARGLITAIDTDQQNLYVVLAARELNPELFIVARAASEEAESRLKRVGANRVLTPYATAGRRLATLALQPLVADFLDTIIHSEALEMLVEELDVRPEFNMNGMTIGELDIRKNTGVVILAIQRDNGRMLTPISGDTRIERGDRLVVLGTREQLNNLEKMR